MKMPIRKQGFYEKYIKRIFDIVLALGFIIVFSWLYLLIAIVVRIKMGSPVLFKQARPGKTGKDGKERIFSMYKFRTMTDERDENGNPLPDQHRLPRFGKVLRATSLDELPEFFNILKGDMSLIGPRPLLVRDLVFMDDRIRMRHTAKPGLSGLAQVNGRNAVTWERKFDLDLQYIEKVSFGEDLLLIWKTAVKVLGHAETKEELDVTDDYGDWLLKNGKISKEKYDSLQAIAKKTIEEYEAGKR